MQSPGTTLLIPNLPVEILLSIWKRFFFPPPGQQWKRHLKIIGYASKDGESLNNYICINAYHYASNEPLVNSSGKSVRLTCSHANEVYKQVLRQRTRNFDPAYIVYSDRGLHGQMRDFWLPVDPEQDIFFFQPDFVRNQVFMLRYLHNGVRVGRWLAESAGHFPELSPAHIMLDVGSLLTIAGECIWPPPNSTAVGRAPDFLLAAFNCCVPSILSDANRLATWLTMFSALQWKPKMITVMVYTRVFEELSGDFTYDDLRRVPYPPASTEEVRQLGFTQTSRVQLAEVLREWAILVNDAILRGLRFPMLEFGYRQR